jgi:CTP synthase
MANRVRVNLEWVPSEIFEAENPADKLQDVHGILVPGGFGQRGAEGKIAAVRFARERKVPYFGICFGMQMAVVEAARNLVGIEKANSSEFGPTMEPVVGLLTEWVQGNELQKRGIGNDLGGTMRLGNYNATLKAGTLISEIYGSQTINERHRHPWFIGVQFHPELKSRPFEPHPLFASFIHAALEQSRLV